jgi:Zn-dependent protease
VTSLLSYVLRFALVFPAIILHEVAHGYVAYLLGDETAKRAGRLSLNPIKHVDLVGTIILPATMLILSGGTYFFGWAKPVPINPWAFKNQREGMLLTGAAGPVTNIVLAALSGQLSRLFVGSGPLSALSVSGIVATVLVYFCQANLVLAFFNLVPIPPLDGSRVVQYFLPDRLRDAYHSVERYGFMLLIGLTWLVPGAFSGYLNLTVEPLLRLFTGL